MNNLFQTKAWLAYQLKAHYRRGHHVHSPYTYRLFTNVLFERWEYYSFQKIESTRRRIGGGQKGAEGRKYGQLLQRLCATNGAKNIVEIGNSNGISTMYLASNDSRSTVYRFVNKQDDKLFGLSGYNNIRQYGIEEIGNTIKMMEGIDMLVVKEEAKAMGIDSIFNEAKEKSREGSIFVFEGIHRDSETENQWKKIFRSPDVTLSIDLFHVGVVWFRSELKRQHYIVKY